MILYARRTLPSSGYRRAAADGDTALHKAASQQHAAVE